VTPELRVAEESIGRNDTERSTNVSLAVATRDQLSDGASRALEVCGMLDALESVRSLVHLDDMKDAPRFIRFDAFVPEVAAGGGGWILATDFDMPFRGRVYHDPTCLVTDSNLAPALYATGGYSDGDVNHPPRKPQIAPDLELPPF
jgi:hypothetical protein